MTLKLKIPPPVIGLVWASVIWALSKASLSTAFLFQWQTVISMIIIAGGFVIELLSVYSFRTAHTTIHPLHPQKTTALVKSGLFKWSRNPMYVGLTLMLTGWTIYLGNFLGFVSLPIFVILLNELQIKPEEQYLSEKFGIEFEEYCKRVRRWI